MGRNVASVVELCSVVSALITTTLFSVSTYLLEDEFEDHCVLYADWTAASNFNFFGATWICTVISCGGFAVTAIGVLFLVHVIASFINGGDIFATNTKSLRFRVVAGLKCFLGCASWVFVIMAAGGAAAGVASYCSSLEDAYNRTVASTGSSYPGCKLFTKVVDKYFDFVHPFPSDTFLRFELILGGTWTSVVSWFVVICSVIGQLLRSRSTVQYTRELQARLV